MLKVLDWVLKYFPWGFGFLYLALLLLALVLSFVLTRRYFENKNHQDDTGGFCHHPKIQKVETKVSTPNKRPRE